MAIKRIILLILDACGVGELPDASEYGDEGASTIPHVASAAGGLSMPHSQSLGLGNIVAIEGVPPAASPLASYGRMQGQSPGKDSTTGHWEIGGVVLNSAFPLFPDGFPEDLVKEFERQAGVKTIGNVAASGTEIIERLGEEHLRTGAIILYTSADSVFQLAAHESLFPPDRLYSICRIARDLLKGPYDVGRVIARPFAGKPGSFVRTAARKDFSRTPPSETVLDILSSADKPVLAIGKIFDLFAGSGISKSIKTANNEEVMQAIIEAVQFDTQHVLIFANLVDFDQLWGHRNDEASFAKALEEYDRRLPELLRSIRESDLLIITADHGCDPTLKQSTDHTREFVPLLVYSRSTRGGVNLGTRTTFADVGASIADLLGVKLPSSGTSFRKDISGV